MALLAARLRQIFSSLHTEVALPGVTQEIGAGWGRYSQLVRGASGVSANKGVVVDRSEGVQSHAQHVSELGLSRAQERESENMASQAEKQEKANWIPREPGLGDKTSAQTLPQDNLTPEALGTTIPEITSRPGMFDPGSLDLRAVKELKAADVARQQEGGSWVQQPPPDQDGAPEQPGKPLNEDQVQESVEKLGERRGGGEGLGEQTKWGATIGRSDPQAGARFSGEESPNKEFPPIHEDPALHGHGEASGMGEGEPEHSPTQVGGQSQPTP